MGAPELANLGAGTPGWPTTAETLSDFESVAV
jgi:hypothetical protein